MKGIIRTVGVFFGTLLVGFIFWRKHEVWQLLASFFGNPTWELIVTSLLALALAMLVAFREYTEWKRDCIRKKRAKATEKVKREIQKETKKQATEAKNEAKVEKAKKPR